MVVHSPPKPPASTTSKMSQKKKKITRPSCLVYHQKSRTFFVLLNHTLTSHASTLREKISISLQNPLLTFIHLHSPIIVLQKLHRTTQQTNCSPTHPETRGNTAPHGIRTQKWINQRHKTTGFEDPHCRVLCCRQPGLHALIIRSRRNRAKKDHEA